MGSRSPPEEQTREFPEKEDTEVARQREAGLLEKPMRQEAVVTDTHAEE